MADTCGEFPAGVSDCPDTIAYYIEWTQGADMHRAGCVCARHGAEFRAGRSPVSGWPVEVTLVRDITSHEELCAAARARARAAASTPEAPRA